MSGLLCASITNIPLAKWRVNQLVGTNEPIICQKFTSNLHQVVKWYCLCPFSRRRSDAKSVAAGEVVSYSPLIYLRGIVCPLLACSHTTVTYSSSLETAYQPAMDESMDIDDQKLARWRHEFIVDIETAKLAKIESGQTQDRGVSEATTATLQNIPQSRESTATIRAVSEFPHAPQDPTDAMDIDEPEATLNTEPDPPSLVVATDFGTTFSSIAFAFRDGEHLPTVKMIMNYPNDPGAFQGRPGLQVPTESWYPNASQLAEMSPDRNSSHSDNADPDDTGEEDLYGTSDMENEPRSHDHTEEPVGNDGASSPSGHHTRDFVWGYGIQNEIAPDKDPKQFDRVARSKLVLDGSKHTKQVRDDLEPVIKRLKRRRIIRTNLDLITDYLTRLFEHAKQELLRSYGYSQLPPIEHVLCVPVLWKSQALRKMQIAFEAAIEQSQFGTMENLFLVSEPEAAAAYVLDKTKSVNVRSY